MCSATLQQDTPPLAGFVRSCTIVHDRTGPYQQGDVLLVLVGMASQEVANMFVKSLIIRAARRLTAFPASVKGQNTSLAAAIERFSPQDKRKVCFSISSF